MLVRVWYGHAQAVGSACCGIVQKTFSPYISHLFKVTAGPWVRILLAGKTFGSFPKQWRAWQPASLCHGGWCRLLRLSRTYLACRQLAENLLRCLDHLHQSLEHHHHHPRHHPDHHQRPLLQCRRLHHCHQSSRSQRFAWRQAEMRSPSRQWIAKGLSAASYSVCVSWLYSGSSDRVLLMQMLMSLSQEQRALAKSRRLHETSWSCSSPGFQELGCHQTRLARPQTGPGQKAKFNEFNHALPCVKLNKLVLFGFFVLCFLYLN